MFTEIWKKREEVLRILNQLSVLKGTEHEQELLAVTQSLSSVYKTCEPLFKRDGVTGLCPKFTDADLTSLKESCGGLSLALGKLENSLLRDPSLPHETCLHLTGELAALEKMAADDSYSLSRARPGMDLAHALDETAERTANISGVKLHATGANLSARIPLTIRDDSGNEVRGFFTKESRFDPLEDWNRIISGLKAKYGNAADPVEALLSRHAQNTGAGPAEALSDMLQQFEKGGKTSDVFIRLIREDMPELDRDPNFRLKGAMLSELTESAKKLFTYVYMNGEELGLKAGDNIDGRNCAMNFMADQLGVPNIIAMSMPMKAISGGQEVRGTFMANAEGNDLGNPADRKVKDLSFKKGYKDLADLQILDYICGNVDRHIQNMLYKFDKEGNFIGVQGIDNDCSFGSKIPDPDKSQVNLPSLNSMKVISESMYRKVMALDVNRMRTDLRHFRLSDEQIRAACGRLELLQEYLRASKKACEKSADDAPLSNAMRILPDDKFDTIDFTDPMDPSYGENYLSGMLNYNFYLEGKEHQQVKQPAVKVLDAGSGSLLKNTARISKAFEDISKVERWYTSGSPQFTEMRCKLGYLSAYMGVCRTAGFTRERIGSVVRQLSVLEKATQAYIDYKEPKQDKSDLAESRLAFAKELKEIVREVSAECRAAAKDFQTRSSRDAEVQRFLTHISRELRDKPMTAELAMDTIRSCCQASRACSADSRQAVLAMKGAVHASEFLMKNDPGFLQKLDGDTRKQLQNTLEKGMKAQKKQKKLETDPPAVKPSDPAVAAIRGM